MLNFYLRQWGQAHRLTPTFIIEPSYDDGRIKRIIGKSIAKINNSRLFSLSVMPIFLFFREFLHIVLDFCLVGIYNNLIF